MISMDLSRLEQFVKQFMAETGTPGVAVALTDREKLLDVLTCGYADVATKKPVTPDTLFQIGSISKSFTAVALMQQSDLGRFRAHSPIADYLPWFQVKSDYEAITAHHCLTHTAGLPNGRYDIPDSMFQVLSLRDVEIPFPPGQHWIYSNLGYAVLTYVLESVSGQSYASVIQQGILQPLGMTASEPVTTNDTRRRLAVGYEHFFDDRPEHKSYPLVPARWVELRSGAGSVSSTARDMTAYLRMLLNRGQGPYGRILSDDAFAQLIQRTVKNPLGHYGYGLNVIEQNGCTYLAHNGNSLGYGAWMIGDLTNGLGVVVLLNSPARGYVVRNFAYSVLRANCLGEEFPVIPASQDPFAVPQAADYAGVYEAGSRSMELSEQDGHLLLLAAGQQVPLESRGQDLFFANHPNYSKFLLRFSRNDQGQVVEAFHGPDWYRNARYHGPATFDYPPEWGAFPGHYRTQHPWWNNFWIVLRKGELVLIHPFTGEQPLRPLEDGQFLVGEHGWSPERVRFDTLLNGQALRLSYSGCDYFRSPLGTP